MICALDTETYLFSPGRMAPVLVCGSVAQTINDKIVGELLSTPNEAHARFGNFFDAGHTIAFANAAYDLAVMAQRDASLLPTIFRALREGRVHDVLIVQALDAIYHGHLGFNADGSELRSPSTGKPSKRYSLEIVTQLVLGRTDAKQNDIFRKSYALLQGIPAERWPEEARVYPKNDAENTLEVALAQVVGRADHSWVTAPRINGSGMVDLCQHCGEEITFGASTPKCTKAPPVPHQNLENLPAQVRTAFALHLGACWGLRTDPERVEKLAAEVEAKHAVAVERFQKKGWIRSDGTRDQAAVKRAVAAAYGASGQCKKCGGTGKFTPMVEVDCRGAKERGRYRGCLGAVCLTCGGTARVLKLGNESTCKVVDGEGCDGTGFDLSMSPMLPRSDKDGVKTDRDTTMESGDEDLADYGENEFEKSRTVYVPWLRTGTVAPLSYSPNAIVATGRCSYEGSPIHQMPRAGGERECIRARGAWCGSPVEYVLGSTDYEAGELCCLFQFCYWLFGYSQGRDAINASGKPGILHSDLAAQVLGISLEEFLARLKAKDKQAIDFRQASKPYNFGRPAAMGAPKIVLTNRKKSTGFTVAENGPARNKKGEPGYWGIRFCVLIGGAKECGVEKIMEWKKYPCAPVCKACVEIVANVLGPAYFKSYPEVKDYHKWGTRMIESAKAAGQLMVRAPCAVWDAAEGAPKIIRERGVALNDYSALLNNGFQAMLADIGKDAFYRATEECYLGVKPDGSPSPLAGCRLPLFAHDEPVSELIRLTAHLSGPRLGEIMEESGRRLAPDVAWVAKTAIAQYLSKSMEPVYDKDNNLILWEPETKAA